MSIPQMANCISLGYGQTVARHELQHKSGKSMGGHTRREKRAPTKRDDCAIPCAVRAELDQQNAKLGAEHPQRLVVVHVVRMSAAERIGTSDA
jgi:hypothetical protein